MRTMCGVVAAYPITFRAHNSCDASLPSWALEATRQMDGRGGRERDEHVKTLENRNRGHVGEVYRDGVVYW